MNTALLSALHEIETDKGIPFDTVKDVLEESLLAAYEKLTEMHNALQVTDPVSTEVVQMWNRPFKVAWADFPGLLHAEIRDPVVLRIAEQWPFGPVDQFRDLLWPHGGRHLLRRLFDQADDETPRAAP